MLRNITTTLRQVDESCRCYGYNVSGVYRRCVSRDLAERKRPAVFVCKMENAEGSSFHYYFPMQNLEKMVERMSVVVMAPVMDER